MQSTLLPSPTERLEAAKREFFSFVLESCLGKAASKGCIKDKIVATLMDGPSAMKACGDLATGAFYTCALTHDFIGYMAGKTKMPDLLEEYDPSKPEESVKKAVITVAINSAVSCADAKDDVLIKSCVFSDLAHDLQIGDKEFKQCQVLSKTDRELGDCVGALSLAIYLESLLGKA
jgi:hypothetical protein